jgi:aminopeptidase N
MKSIPTFVFSLLAGLSLPANSFAFSDTLKTEAKKSTYRASSSRQNDIIHTRLDVSFDWDKARMNGKATITAKPYFHPTSKLSLNARGMDVQSVEVFDMSSGKPQQVSMSANNPEMIGSKKLNSSYKYENDSIKINLGREFTAEEKYMVKINYVAKPNEIKKGGSAAITDDKGLFFINNKGEEKNKMPQIWTQGETQASSAWFPTIDSPNEKMTDEIFMTVDQKYTTLSNGVLADSKKNTDGTRTDHWKMDLPHSPYLVMMGVGEFKKVTDAPWNGKEISYYVEKEYEPYAKAIFGNTKEMIDFYSKVLGTPYPWQKYAQIVVRDYVSGAMENTSSTLHGDFMVYQTDREILDGKKGESVIAHELFHQWFGDLVTCESWSNLPLNESFATYGAYLWEEYKNGRDAADAYSYQSRMGYFNAAQEKQVNVIRFDYEKQEDMFDAWSYNKGGQILHMLRKYTGDKAFFASLKLYLERNRFKSAEIHDLRLAFEEVTGEDLNWFFNEWFMSKGHPELLIEKNYDAQTKKLNLKVTQKQNLAETPLYVLPVDVDVYSGSQKERHRIIIDQAVQEFDFIITTKPDLVNFDAERQLLGIKTYSKSTEEYIFQYKNAPLFSDRFEALTNLKPKIDQPEVYALFKQAMENDNWHELRGTAMQAFKPQATAKESDLKPLLIKIAGIDKSTNVRALAVNFLAENYKGPELEELYNRSTNEQSYVVIASGLKALSLVNSSVAMQKAKVLEKEKNETIFGAIATVYSRHGADENNQYFINKKEDFSSFGYITYVKQYGKFLKRCEQAKSFETAATIFADIIKTGNEYVKDYARKSYQESIINLLKTKTDELKTANVSSEKIKELESTKTKLEDMYKSISVL